MDDLEVVVGYDGSGPSNAAVDWAAVEAVRRGLPLTVLQVAGDGDAVPCPPTTSTWFPQTESAPEHHTTVAGARRARRVAPEVDVTAMTVVGPVSGGLIWASRQASLLVLGRRRRGRVATGLLGSVAVSVMARAYCPAIVVPEDGGSHPGPGHRVAVGVDGSGSAAEALRLAADVCVATGAPLTVVCAWSVSRYDDEGAPPTRERPMLQTPEDEARQGADRMVRAAASAVHEWYPHLDVATRVVEGPVLPALASVAETGLGLLVVGSRGHAGLAGLLLGSVSQGLIDVAACPVAVVRAGAARPLIGAAPRTS
jgi:nucleotide-binding universal stress UspA family protein